MNSKSRGFYNSGEAHSTHYRVIESYNCLMAGEVYENHYGPDCPGQSMNVALRNPENGEVTFIDRRKVSPIIQP